MHRRSVAAPGLAACVLLATFGSWVRGATINQAADDPSGTSSFTTGSNFGSSGAGTPPAAGNNYVSTDYVLRTPADSSSNTFGGDALTLSDLTTAGKLLLLGDNGGTQTVGHLLLGSGSSGAYLQYAPGPNTTNTNTLAGNITLSAGTNSNIACSSLNAGTGGNVLTVSAAIGGTGSLTINNTAFSTTDTSTVVFSGADNYTGTTTVAAGMLTLSANASLGGTSTVIVAGGAVLNLNAPGVVNPTQLNAFATILLSSNATAYLNFLGNETIAQLSLDGGKTFLAPGFYSAITEPELTGNGSFAVTGVPEPDARTSACLGLTVLGLALKRTRRRARTCSRTPGLSG